MQTYFLLSTFTLAMEYVFYDFITTNLSPQYGAKLFGDREMKKKGPKGSPVFLILGNLWSCPYAFYVFDITILGPKWDSAFLKFWTTSI